MVRRAMHLGTLLALLLSAAQAPAQQHPGAMLPPPSPATSLLPPLLYVKIIGPNGMQVTILRGGEEERTLAAPCVIGVRPGYLARVALSGIPGYASSVFFPTFEVHGSLMLASAARQADFPAAVVFRGEDFARAKADVSLTKIVVLEKPDDAVPVTTSPDEPFEIAVPAVRDPLRQARAHGQPMLVVRMGERQMTRDEITNAPGTVLLPGETFLAPPSCPPPLAWSCSPVLDPRAGGIHPSDYICVPDGGDVGLPAGFDRQGKLRGLDPSDTVAEYSDNMGRQRLAISNRVCICVPRFVVVSTAEGLANQVARYGPSGMNVAAAYASASRFQPTLEHQQRTLLETAGLRLKPSGTAQVVGPAVTGRVNNLVVSGTVYHVQSMEAACQAGAEAPPGPLLIIKWPDHCDALVGDIVTFTLRYTNTGGQPITNVIVSDSLTTRLEYVPGSAKTDREAIFTMQPNEAGSLVLRWEITGTLRPRESGFITFQVKVR